MHYAAHNFQLALSNACAVPCLRNCTRSTTKVRYFFNALQKLPVLQEEIAKVDLRSKVEKDVCNLLRGKA